MSYRHILVAVDLTDPSDKVMSRAVSLAKDSGARLSLINVDISHPDSDIRDYDQAEKRLLDKEHAELVNKLSDLAEIIDYPVSYTLVVDGDVEDKLIENVNKLEADLLISGHHHGFWNRWWSSARKLVNMATVDLLLISI